MICKNDVTCTIYDYHSITANNIEYYALFVIILIPIKLNTTTLKITRMN